MTASKPGIDDFLASKRNRGHIRSRTAAQYKTELEEFQRFLNGREQQRPIWAAQRDDINLFLSERGADNLPSWKSRRLAPIKEYFKYLQQERFRTDNPTTGVQLAKARPRSEPPLVLSREEMRKLLSAPKGRLAARDKAIIHVFYAGLKKADVVALSGRDVDLDKKQVKVSERHVPLTQEAVDAIAEYLKVHPIAKGQPLFPGRSNRRMDRQIWQIVKKYVDQCGLDEKTTLETLRATYAVHAMVDGISYMALINALGTFNDDWLRGLTQIAQSLLKAESKSATEPEALSGIRVYAPGDDYTFYRDLAGEIANAQTLVMIVDGYLDEHVFDLYVKKIQTKVPVRMLSMKVDDDVEAIAKRFGASRKIELRRSKQIHDRYLFIDKRGWVIGQSIKDAAREKPTYVIELAEPSLGAIREAHEAIWDAAAVVI